MEEEITLLKHRLRYMAGIRFESMRRMWNGVTVTHGWYMFFGFYWFSLAFLKRWPLENVYAQSTGLIFSYKPNPAAKYGDLMWLKNKKWLWSDYPKERHDAA